MGESAIQEVICGIGYPVVGNPMQFLMERAFAAAGLDSRFLTFEVLPEKLGDAVAGVKAMNFRGAALMTPHASRVLDLVDRLSPAADLAQAANCLVREGDQWTGDNTLGEGFLQSLPADYELADKHVVILGAGAVGRSIAAVVAQQKPADLCLLDETTDRGRAFVERLNERLACETRFQPWTSLFAIPESTQLVVQATGLGWCDSQAVLPLQLDSLSDRLFVVDVNYNPPETWLYREAREHGCQVLSGIEMLVRQAALAFEKWTSTTADLAVIREAAEEYLEV